MSVDMHEALEDAIQLMGVCANVRSVDPLWADVRIKALKKFRRSILECVFWFSLAGFLLGYMIGRTRPAFGAEIPSFRWTVPCFEPLPSAQCESLSTTPETGMASIRFKAVRLAEGDTLSFTNLDERGAECTADSASFPELAGSPYVEMLTWNVGLSGKESCPPVHYLMAYPDSFWDSPPIRFGLLGSYYRDKRLESLVGSREDPQVDFDWATFSPFPGCPADSFSVRWTGFLRPRATGIHSFRLNVNDAGRLWVGPWKVLDDWDTGDGWHSVSGQAPLTAGVGYPITLEMKELWYICGAKLYWTPPGEQEELIPTTAYSH